MQKWLTGVENFSKVIMDLSVTRLAIFDTCTISRMTEMNKKGYDIVSYIHNFCAKGTAFIIFTTVFKELAPLGKLSDDYNNLINALVDDGFFVIVADEEYIMDYYQKELGISIDILNKEFAKLMKDFLPYLSQIEILLKNISSGEKLPVEINEVKVGNKTQKNIIFRENYKGNSIHQTFEYLRTNMSKNLGEEMSSLAILLMKRLIGIQSIEVHYFSDDCGAKRLVQQVINKNLEDLLSKIFIHDTYHIVQYAFYNTQQLTENELKEMFGIISSKNNIREINVRQISAGSTNIIILTNISYIMLADMVYSKSIKIA